MCCDKVLQVCVDASFQDSQECITDGVNLALLVKGPGKWSWSRGGWLSRSSGLVFRDLEGVLIQCLRDILLASLLLAASP